MDTQVVTKVTIIIKSLFLYTQIISKVELPDQAVQEEGKKVSLDAQVDVVIMLAWMANVMEMLTGAIEKFANVNTVLESAI